MTLPRSSRDNWFSLSRNTNLRFPSRMIPVLYFSRFTHFVTKMGGEQIGYSVTLLKYGGNCRRRIVRKCVLLKLRPLTNLPKTVCPRRRRRPRPPVH